MAPRRSVNFTNLSNPINLPTNDAAAEAAAYHKVEQEEEEEEALTTSPPPNATTATTTTVTTTPTTPSPRLTNEDLTPHQIAIKRTKTAKARLAIVYEGWGLAVQALVRSGLVPADEGISAELEALGDAIAGRYTASSFLWRVLMDMPAEDWFGLGTRFDDTLRRLRTLKGLEASLVCWERIVLELVELVDGRGVGGGGREVGGEEVGRVLGRWRRGVPSRP
ncbi:hypothetical protein C8A00DRAFT_45401 [Chaetomidium leptoderma]|uniref:Uncharacterized protein n=1 Tax=Chaetomidium leptoderma TaxID=669021 RepID=A0AAN6VJL8_9PEZI|nr:hypothetical protein C8A00DRAFT_45401 [Chaetomidium leptoderma]